ncbi:MAG TPA: hypothetical protein VMX17_13905 [Candidatus Glassbacteria bacterium]|nr:hypothetical protein [Candidatus Glassbacteria bacterium]
MSKSSGGGISLGGIFFLIFIYNLFFDDDADKKEVVIHDKDKGVIEEVKETIEEIKPEVKEAIIKAKESFEKVLNKDTQEEGRDEKEKSPTPEIETNGPEEGVKL